MHGVRAQRMLLGIAIGDAFGAAYEFVDQRKPAAALQFNRYGTHPKHPLPPGMYTDDTQMSIGVAEYLLNGKEGARALADTFVSCYRRDPILGYAQHFQTFLDSVQSGEEFLQKIRPASDRNGAAMRAVPFGVLPTLDAVVHNARLNASLTHNTPNGLASSVAVAVLSHQAYHGLGFNSTVLLEEVARVDADMAAYLGATLIVGPSDVSLFVAPHGVPCDGIKTVAAALHALRYARTARGILERAIRFGGDVDSVAAIALGIGMQFVRDDLPAFLFEDLTNHAYGREYLLELGSQLHRKFPSRADSVFYG